MNKVRMCGFDASTKKTGFCIMDNAEMIDYGLLDYSEIDDKETRTKMMCKAILEKLNFYKPEIIVIEDSWNAMNVEVTKILTRVMGVTYGWALENNCEWHTLLPSQWRKLCGLNQGKKKRQELKEMSIQFVKDKYDIDVNDDVADAIALSIGYVNSFAN